jgi:hypothetical protein
LVGMRRWGQAPQLDPELASWATLTHALLDRLEAAKAGDDVWIRGAAAFFAYLTDSWSRTTVRIVTLG